MEDWRGFLIEILEELGGEANLSNDIYPLVEKKDSLNLPRTWKATLRNALEMNSSDSMAWNKKYDIFKLKDKGNGVWALRSPKDAKKLNLIDDESNLTELINKTIKDNNFLDHKVIKIINAKNSLLKEILTSTHDKKEKYFDYECLSLRSSMTAILSYEATGC